MHPMINTAVKAARQAGLVIMRAFDDIKRLSANAIESKGRHDFVTSIDKAAEKIIIDTLLKAYPSHSILAEESGEIINHSNNYNSYNSLDTRNNTYQWIIDPLDGTLNFINGFPHFCISIALKVNNTIEHGVIYDPVRNELFTASKGSGAYLDNKRIRVNQRKSINGSFLATGFPVRTPEQFEQYLASFSYILTQASDIRRAGSAALDLAYVAAGRLDGYWESGLKIWDLAAGSLMIIEAGGYVGDYNGSEEHLNNGSIIASNIKIYKELLKIIASS